MRSCAIPYARGAIPYGCAARLLMRDGAAPYARGAAPNAARRDSLCCAERFLMRAERFSMHVQSFRTCAEPLPTADSIVPNARKRNGMGPWVLFLCGDRSWSPYPAPGSHNELRLFPGPTSLPSTFPEAVPYMPVRDTMSMSRKKKWTTELFTQDVYPLIALGEASKYLDLPFRETIILACSVLDAALLELISKRLDGPEHEIVEFLGADEDGRAPCGSFGSRIQLAHLLGILVEDDVRVLRLVKKLRNKAAHRFKLDVSDDAIGNVLCQLFDLMKIPFWVVAELIKSSTRTTNGLSN